MTAPVRFKLCGLTRAEDAVLASAVGAWAIGVVLWPGSPRAAGLGAASKVFASVPETVERVAVLVRPSVDEARLAMSAGASMLQLHAVDDVQRFEDLGLSVILAGTLQDDVRAAVTRPDDVLYLLDAHDPVRHGGTGQAIDWVAARAVTARRRVLLAGGLTAANVGRAILTARPWGVDVSSGVERSPGIKDESLVRQFAAAVRTAAAADITAAGGTQEVLA